MTEALTSNYWISPNAVRITLNAMGKKDYIQCGAAGGAVVMCYIRDIDGLGYDAGHNYRRWPIVTAPVYFNSWTRKYVYIAIPRSTAVGTSAILVFPSERIDLYGMTEPAEGETEGEQIGSKDYYYIFLRGVISPSRSDDGADQLREWEEYVDYGTLSTDQQVSEGDSEWWRYNADDDTVTFLKVITNATFKVLNVLKNLTVGGDGSFGGSLSVAKDAIISGLFTAYNTRINDIKSSNYNGDGMADTGFHITNSWGGSGNSGAVFDYLTIRKKMIVQSLEVKEIEFSAGDQGFSCASAIIKRTDYIDKDGNVLGYSVVKVPWLMKGLSFLLRGRDPLGVFSRKKKVRMTLTPTQLSQVRRVRCYFLAEDGERKIENWWRVNDLARCQTQNVTQAVRETYTDITQSDGNVYWWRKVLAVSANTGTPRYIWEDEEGNRYDSPGDGRTKKRDYNGARHGETDCYPENEHYGDTAKIDGEKYHWFDVAYDYDKELAAFSDGKSTGWCDLYSDIPAAGDKVVQFGSAVDPNRMNVTTIEVNGSGNSDAPSIKTYRGIYSFNSNMCWWGGHPRKMKLSPATGYEFYGPMFKFIQEYGVARVPLMRPERLWSSIAFDRDDEAKADYPDYSDDVRNAAGVFVRRSDITHSDKRNVRKCYYYDEVTHNGALWICSIANEEYYWKAKETFGKYQQGDRISDADYASFSDEQKTLCERARSYATTEPSEDSAEWTKLVDQGEAGAFLSRVFTRSNTVPIAPSNDIRDGYNTFDHPVPPPTGGHTWSDGVPNGSAILWSSTAWFYADGKHSDWTSPAPETDTADLDIEFSKNYSKPNPPVGDAPIPESDTSYKAGDAEHGSRANGSGEDADWYDTNKDASKVIWDDMIWRAERKIKNGEYVGTWSITRIKGEDGFTPVSAYRWYKEEAVAETAPKAPSGNSKTPKAEDYYGDTTKARPGTMWSEYAENRPDRGWILYMTYGYKFNDGTYGQWERPIPISGVDGTPGEDSDNVEWIYILKPSVYDFPPAELPANINIGQVNPSEAASGSDTNKNQKGWVPNGWYDHAQGVSKENTVLYASFRDITSDSENNKTYGAFHTPIIWSHWGRNGMDGDGFEYVFIRTSKNIPPLLSSATADDSHGNKVLEDEYLPMITNADDCGAETNGKKGECTDDPKGVNPTFKYEWVAKRTKGNANADTGVRTWKSYYECAPDDKKMALWTKWSDNAVRIDLDNQADLISLDAEGKVRFARTIVVNAKIYDGGKVVTSGVTNTTTDSLVIGGCTPDMSLSGGVLTITWAFTKGMAATADEKTIKLTYDGEEYSAQFSLGATDRDVIYQVLPNPDKVSFSRNSNNELSPASISLVCDITKDTGSGTIQTITNITDYNIESSNNYLYYRVKNSNGNWGDWTKYTRSLSVGSNTTKLDVEFAISTVEKTSTTTNEQIEAGIYEREVVPIVKDGLNGNSITKTREVYQYGVTSSSETSPEDTVEVDTHLPVAEGYWYSDGYKIDVVALWTADKWLWEKTIIYWSDDSETELVTNMRNPNDGEAGQDIVVDGATDMKYCCKDSNTIDPRTIPDSDWKDYGNVTKVKGQWLWSRATTNYKKATDGSFAGSSVNYNVSYIAEDGNGIASITNWYAISAYGIPAEGMQKPSDIRHADWQDDSPEANPDKPYLWKKEVTSYTVGGDTTIYYCIGRYGDNGIDAKDAEWVYVRTTEYVAPTIAQDTETPQGYKNDDYKPLAKVSSGRIKGGTEADANTAVRCTDDPQGVNDTWKYEWEIKREKGAIKSDNSRDWNDYYVSGANPATMTLHNNLAESTLVIDIDNDNDQFSTDSLSKVLTRQDCDTYVTMLYGTEEMDFTSVPDVTLYYDDGTRLTDESIAKTAATKITDKQYMVRVRIYKTPNDEETIPFDSHSGLYVDITGTCSKGTKTIRFNIEKVMSNAPGVSPAIYQLVLTNRVLSYGRDGSNNLVAKNNSVTVNIRKTIGDVSEVHTSLQTGDPTISWGFENETEPASGHSGKSAGFTLTLPVNDVGNHTNVWFKLTTGDKEDVAIVTDGTNGSNGTSPFIADCDNEMDSVACDENGNAVALTRLYTKLSAFYGSTEKTAESTVRLISNDTGSTSVELVSSGTATGSGTTIDDITPQTMASAQYVRVTFNAGVAVAQRGAVVLEIAHTTYGTRQLTFTVNGVRPGADGLPATIYNLKPSQSDINVGRNGSAYVPATATLTCGYVKNQGGVMTTVDDVDEVEGQSYDIDNTYNIYYRLRRRSNSTYATKYYLYHHYKEHATVGLNGFSVATIDAVEFIISKDKRKIIDESEGQTPTSVIDRETVPVVADGQKGEDGRGLTSQGEWYKASALDGSDAAHSETVPEPGHEAENGWSQYWDLRDLDPEYQWSEALPYLWNCEKSEFSSGTAVEWTTPHIVAVFGKVIDSIVNYYKILNTAEPSEEELKRIDEGGTGWDDDPTAPGPGQFQWNYECITYIESDGSNSYSYTDVHISVLGGDVIFQVQAFMAFTKGSSPSNKPDIITGITAETTVYSTNGKWLSTPPTVLSSTQQTYVSKATVKNGNVVDPDPTDSDNNGWSKPAPYSGDTGPKGEDGWTVWTDPDPVFLNQDMETGQFPLPTVYFHAKHGDDEAEVGTISSTYSSTLLIISFGTGQFTITNIYKDPDGNYPSRVNVVCTVPVSYGSLSTEFTITVPIYVNPMAEFSRKIANGVETAIGTLTQHLKDPDTGEIIESKDLLTQITSAQEFSTNLSKSVGNNLLQGLATGEGWENENGGGLSFTYSTFEIKDNAPKLHYYLYSPLVYLGKGWYVLSYYTRSSIAIDTYLCYDSSHLNNIGRSPHSLPTQQVLTNHTCVEDEIGYRHILRFKIGSSGVASDNGYYSIMFSNQSVIRPQLERGSAADSEPTSFVGTSAVQSQSLFKQTSDSIDLSVTSKLGEAGINIAGSDRSVNLYADKVKFYKNKASATTGDPAKIWIDGGDGSLHAVDGNFSGRLVVKRMVHTTLDEDVTTNLSLPGTDEEYLVDTYYCAADNEIMIDLRSLESLEYQGIELTFINKSESRVKLRGNYFCYTIIDNGNLTPYFTSANIYVPGIAPPVKLMLVQNNKKGWGFTWYVISGIVSSF